MKLVCTSDWHIRLNNPENRIDDYVNNQIEKVRWILRYCRDQEAVLVIAGDLFDSPNTPRWLVNKYLELFTDYGVDIVACAGQHDQHFHSLELRNTPIGTFYSSGLVQKAWGHITAVDWDEEYTPDTNDVLIVHRCVTEKPNEFIPYSYTASEMMKKYKDKRFIISGDYHVPHFLQQGNRLLINPGSLMRSGKNQYDYEPCVWVLDTQDGDFGRVYIPIKPASEVFNLDNMDRVDDKAEVDKRFDDLINSFNDEETKPDYESNLNMVVESYKPTESVVAITSNVMEVCNERRSC